MVSKRQEEKDVRKMLQQKKGVKKEATKKERKQQARAATGGAAPAKEVARKRRAVQDAARDEEEAPEFPEPPYRYDVHLKKQELYMTIVLHKIPPQHVDVSKTTNTRLHVDTTKFSKKFVLDMPYPEGMAVDAEAGEFVLENGELRIRLPITKMPGTIAKTIEGRLEAVRAAQKKRFRVTQDGKVVVRSRTTSVQKPPAAPKKDEAAAKAEAEAAAKAKADDAPSKKKRKVVKSDSAEVNVAALAAQAAMSTLEARLQKSRELQARRSARAEQADARKEKKEGRSTDAFNRLVQRKREELAAKESMKTVKKDRKPGTGKSVRFD